LFPFKVRPTPRLCPDFAAQKIKLQEFCDANNIIVDMSPKCHPEIAGLGIEYCWAVAKTLFRNKNDFLHQTLSRCVQDALDAITLGVIWKCARRARDYMRGYRVLGGGELPKKEIEEQAKEQKRHTRDVLNFSSDWIWIRSMLALCQPNAGAASTHKKNRIARNAKTAPIDSSRRASLQPSSVFFGACIYRQGAKELVHIYFLWGCASCLEI
jgi:hypothetical protein